MDYMTAGSPVHTTSRSICRPDIGHDTFAFMTQNRTLELCLVVPTFNEAENVTEVVDRVASTLNEITWEIIFVDDDSTDGTASIVRKIGATDHRVRCIQRIGRRGLSSACVEGLLATSADIMAVMDADLQHDETRLLTMYDEICKGAELVVATRYADGGSTGSWSSKRQAVSRIATFASRLIMKQHVSDPMSGFFMLRRSVFEGCVRGLSSIGYKMLLDIIASSPRSIKIAEVPYTFRTRRAGASKLDEMVVWEFAMLLADKTIGRFVPVRFVSFSIIGGLGVFVHMAVLSILFQGIGYEFITSQSIATLGAMIFNFSLNNILTYRDRRLRGAAWIRGLLAFIIACSVGALANIGVANYLFENRGKWVLAAIAGVLVGAVWNYAITQIYTWKKKTA